MKVVFCSLRTGFLIGEHRTDLLKDTRRERLVFASKEKPSHEASHNSHQHPLQIEQGIARVAQVVWIIIVRTILTMASVFRTVVLIFVPARLMHRMFTLRHDLVARLKGSLTQIAVLGYQCTIDTHLATTIDSHILILEVAVTDIGLQILHHQPDNQHDKQRQQQPGNQDIDA